MSELLDYISTWSIIKWIVLVLVAGFIGQFGRMTAEAVTARVRLRRAKRKAHEDKPTSSGEAPVTMTMPVEPPRPTNAPIIKSVESATPAESIGAGPAKSPISGIDRPITPHVTDHKKALKAAEKVRKKALKASQKAAKK